MLTLLRSWIPTAITLGVGSVLGGLPSGRDVVVNHPVRVIVACVAWAIITHVLPSPVPHYRSPWD